MEQLNSSWKIKGLVWFFFENFKEQGGTNEKFEDQLDVFREVED